MLASIHPLGERAKGNRWGVTATAYVAGSLAGGLVLGGLAGLLGELLASVLEIPGAARVALVAMIAVAAAATDLRLFGLRIPTPHRQVNEDWLNRYRGWVYGVGYGFQLGLGVTTVVTTAALYAAIALAVLAGSLAGGLLIGGLFGLVRGLAILPGARITTHDHLRLFHRTLDARARLATRLAGVAEVVLVLAVLGGLVAT
jgi:hypothetical protein